MSTKPDRQEQTIESANEVMYITDKSVSDYTLDVLNILGKTGAIILRSRGRFIPTTVAVANIVTEEMLKGNSLIKKILLDTESEPGIGRMTSTIEIFIESKKLSST